MKKQDWFVDNDGNFQLCQSAREWDLLQENYRLYRFLTELENILAGADNIDLEAQSLPDIRRLIRRLIVNSYWVRSQFSPPDPKTGTSVHILYDELGFPFTFQTVSFAPGIRSNIHNHGTWGIVAILKGKEKNTLWKTSANTCVEQTGEIILQAGDIISFTPDAIHSIEALGDEPTVTLNLYGETDPTRRFEFDPITQRKWNY